MTTHQESPPRRAGHISWLLSAPLDTETRATVKALARAYPSLRSKGQPQVAIHPTRLTITGGRFNRPLWMSIFSIITPHIGDSSFTYTLMTNKGGYEIRAQSRFTVRIHLFE